MTASPLSGDWPGFDWPDWAGWADWPDWPDFDWVGFDWPDWPDFDWPGFDWPDEMLEHPSVWWYNYI